MNDHFDLDMFIRTETEKSDKWKAKHDREFAERLLKDISKNTDLSQEEKQRLENQARDRVKEMIRRENEVNEKYK